MRYLKFILVVGLLVINGFAFGQGCWSKIVSQGYHVLAIKQDGTLWAWGFNYYGQLGLGGVGVNQNTPTQIGHETWIDVSITQFSSFAIRSDSTLWRWGMDLASQQFLGYTDIVLPTQFGTDSNWEKISSTLTFVIGQKSNNTLWGWGSNIYGQLGNGTTNFCHLPTQIGSDSDWKMAAAGGQHTIAIKQDGTLWAWGRNESVFGNGTLISSLLPIQIGLTTNNVEVDCGYYHTIVRKNDSTLWVSGRDLYPGFGTVGLGAVISNPTLTQIGSNKWKSFSCGLYHTSAISANGTLWAWGRNDGGQLGDGTYNHRNVPIQVSNQLIWSKVFSGYENTFAISNNDLLYSCGANGYGTLADGTFTGKTTFIPIYCPKNIITSTSFTNKICKGDSINVQFNASGIYPTNVFTLEMSNANGSFSSPFVLATLAGDTNGNYSINALVPLTTSSGTNYRFRIKSSKAYVISEDNGMNVSIHPKPTITISTNSCNTSLPILSASGASTYLWSTGATTSSIFAGTNSFVQYSVTGTDTNGCSNSANEHINTLTPITMSCNSSILSQHQGLTYGAGYVWMLPNCGLGGVLNGQVKKYSFTPPTTGMFILSISASSGGFVSWSYKDANQACEIDNWICIGSTNVATNLNFGPLQAGVEYIISGKANTPGLVSQTITITSDPVTLPTVSTTTPICGIATATLAVTNNPNATIEWYDAATGGNLLATNDTFTTPTISATKNYWVQAVEGCGSTSARTQVTQIVNPKPEVTTTASNTKVCKNSHVVLNGAGANTYTWSNGAYNNIPFPVSSTTIYTVTGTDANNCTNTSTIEIEVKDLPAITINASQDTICNGDITMLSATGGSAYTWSGGIFDQTPFIPTATTTYTVTGTGAYSCTNTATKTVVVKNCNLNLKIFLQGYYTSNGMMQNVLFNEGIEPYPSFNVDTVTVELHKYFSPYALVETQKGILRMDGKLMVNFNADSTGEYYIVLKHRNHLQSWSSASANFLQANAVVNFTFSNGKTYGQNVAEVEPGIFAFYSGDINQDGSIDGLDYPFWENDYSNSAFGNYNTDLNGDGSVDGLDYPLWENNYNQSVFFAAP